MEDLEVIINSHGHPLSETLSVPKDVTLKFAATRQHVCTIDSWGSALNEVHVLRREHIGEKIKYSNDIVENYRITFGDTIDSNPMNVFIKTVNIHGQEVWNPLYTEEEKRVFDTGQITLRDLIDDGRIHKDGKRTIIYCLFCRGSEGSSTDITMNGVDFDAMGDFDMENFDMGTFDMEDNGSFGMSGGERVRKKTKRKKSKGKKKKSKSRQKSRKKIKNHKLKIKRKIKRNYKTKSKA